MFSIYSDIISLMVLTGPHQEGPFPNEGRIGEGVLSYSDDVLAQKEKKNMVGAFSLELDFK